MRWWADESEVDRVDMCLYLDARTHGTAITTKIRVKVLLLRAKSKAIQQCQISKVPSRPIEKLPPTLIIVCINYLLLPTSAPSSIIYFRLHWWHR